MNITLAMGRASLQTAIRWNTEPVYDGREPATAVRECCLRQETPACNALGAIKSVIFLYAIGNALPVTDVITYLAEEWRERFKGFWAVGADRGMMRVYFYEGLAHSVPGDFTFGRITKSGEFVEVDGGSLAQLYDIDAYREQR